MATAASAAAMAIIKMVKKNPSSLFGHKYLLNAIKLVHTIQYQFNAHQHGNQISSCKETIYTDEKQCSADE